MSSYKLNTAHDHRVMDICIYISIYIYACSRLQTPLIYKPLLMYSIYNDTYPES